MDAYAWMGIGLSGAVALVGTAWAWWRHRVRLSEMQRQLAWNEQSRFELERHTQALDLRLSSMAQTLKSLESSRELESALSRGDARLASPRTQATTWKDTEPMPADANPYAETMPLELADASPPVAPQAGAHPSFRR